MDVCVQIAFSEPKKDVGHCHPPEHPNYRTPIISDLVVLVNLVKGKFFVEMMTVRRKFVKVKFNLMDSY